MTNLEVVKNFIMGENKGKAGTLRIEGDDLVHYNTVIAKRDRVGRDVKKVHLNNTKYTASTSKVQTMIRKETPSVLLTEYEGDSKFTKLAEGVRF